MAVGILAVGLTLGLLDRVRSVMTSTWVASNPAHIKLWNVGWTRGGIDRDTVEALGTLPGVAGTEGMARMGTRWRREADGDWREATLVARDRYEDQRYDRLVLVEGSWPGRGGITMDRGRARLEGLEVGDTVYLEVRDRSRLMTLAGITYSTWVDPPAFTDEASFFVTRSDLVRLGGPANFTRVMAVTPSFQEESATTASVAISDRLDELGIEHSSLEVLDPSRHFFQDAADGVFFVLVVMSVLGLVLSLFLVVNTITAIMTEQVPQIGAMKAIGGTSWGTFRLYLTETLGYIVLALLLAIPLAAIAAHLLSTWLLGLLNMEPDGFQASTNAVVVQVALGLLGPLAAAVWPLRAGTRITVREAISTYGLGRGIGVIDRALARLRRLPPLVRLTISNTFRRKSRLVMTQIALVGGGAIFLMVMSVQASMVNTFDVFLGIYNFDVILGFDRPHRTSEIEGLVESFPGVESAEALQFWRGDVRRPDDTEGRDEARLTIVGVSEKGSAYGEVVTAGRWLLPEDDRAIVLNQDLAKRLEVSVGDDVVLHLRDEDKEWTIVGLLFDINDDQTASAVWLDVLDREIGRDGRAGTLFVKAVDTDEQRLESLARDLRSWLDDNGKDISFSLTASAFKSQQISSLMIIVYLMAAVAILIGAVGSVALSGTLSINALERQREIGMMRAIGASGRAIGGILVGEGLIIGLLSWAIAIPLSIPLGWAFTTAIGSTIELTLVYKYSMAGALLWLGVVVVLSALASGLPAWRSSRISVRETLAYE